MTSPGPLLFDRPAIVAGEDKLQTDVIASQLRGVVVPEVVRTRDFAQALSLARPGGFALHIVGWDKNPLDAVEYILGIRRNRDSRDRAAPIIVACAAPTANDYKLAQEAGATAVFAKPLAIGPLLKLFAKVKADVRPFVDTQDYVGPCRRRAILSSASRRRRSDAPDPASSAFASASIKYAMVLFNQVAEGDLDQAAETAARLRLTGEAAADAMLVAALDQIGRAHV